MPPDVEEATVRLEDVSQTLGVLERGKHRFNARNKRKQSDASAGKHDAEVWMPVEHARGVQVHDRQRRRRMCGIQAGQDRPMERRRQRAEFVLVLLRLGGTPSASHLSRVPDLQAGGATNLFLGRPDLPQHNGDSISLGSGPQVLKRYAVKAFPEPQDATYKVVLGDASLELSCGLSGVIRRQ